MKILILLLLFINCVSESEIYLQALKNEKSKQEKVKECENKKALLILTMSPNDPNLFTVLIKDCTFDENGNKLIKTKEDIKRERRIEQYGHNF